MLNVHHLTSVRYVMKDFRSVIQEHVCLAKLLIVNYVPTLTSVINVELTSVFPLTSPLAMVAISLIAKPAALQLKNAQNVKQDIV